MSPIAIGSVPIQCECGDVKGTVEERLLSNAATYRVYDLAGKFYIGSNFRLFCFICRTEVTRR
jgi:hypothetical protein